MLSFSKGSEILPALSMTLTGLAPEGAEDIIEPNPQRLPPEVSSMRGGARLHTVASIPLYASGDTAENHAVVSFNGPPKCALLPLL